MTTLNNYVQILPDKPKTTSDGGIIIPDKAQEAPKSGIVERIGPILINGTIGNHDVLIGKRVYYPAYSPFTQKIGNIEYHFVKYEELILVTDGN